MDFLERLNSCNTVADVFSLVKEIVLGLTGREQAGLMVGMSDLGRARHGFIGAYYTPFSNMIIINSRALGEVRWGYPGLIRHYLFHLILHEYVHSLGVYDEAGTRMLVHEISNRIGDDVLIRMAADMGRYFPEIVYSDSAGPPSDPNIYFVEGIDRKSLDYIG